MEDIMVEHLSNVGPDRNVTAMAWVGVHLFLPVGSCRVQMREQRSRVINPMTTRATRLGDIDAMTVGLDRVHGR